MCVFAYMMSVFAFFLKVGFDPHPHMRVPGMPPSLTGIPGGKPYVYLHLLLCLRPD